MTTIINLTSDQRDAIRLWESIMDVVARAGMYSDGAIEMVLEAVDKGWNTGLNDRQRRAIRELMEAAIDEE